MMFADLIDNKLTRSNLDKLHKEIFDFDYSFYDGLRKGELERKLLRHYMFYPIGFDDLDTFKFYLENYFITQVEAYYNNLYLAQNKLKPYEAVGTLSTTTMRGSNTTTDNTSTNIVVDSRGSNSSQTTTNATTNNTTNVTDNNESTQTGGTTSTVTDNTKSVTTNSSDSTDKINQSTQDTGGDTTVYGRKIHVNYDYPVNVEAMSELAGTTASVETEHTDTVNKNTTTTVTGNNTNNTTNNGSVTNTGTVTTANGVTDDFAQRTNSTSSTTGKTTDDMTTNVTGSSSIGSSTTNSGEHTGRSDNEQNISIRTSGLANSMSEEYIKYKTAIDNIDMMVINGCRDLFMIVWD